MKICKLLSLLSLVLVMMLSVPVAFGESPAPPTSYVTDSEKSGTRVQTNEQWTVDSGQLPETATPAEAVPRYEESRAEIQTIAKSREPDNLRSEISHLSIDLRIGQPTPTPTPPEIQSIIDACAATAADLKSTRAYAAGLEAQNKLLQDRLETEKRATAILTELNDTRRAEASALRSALEAKNETIAAKDAAIAAQDKLIAELKKKKPSPWRRLGDILIGAAVFAVLK